MSIKIMTRVWEKSKKGGSQLLLLLAIADNANDGGFAWPGQEYLAKKIRMSTKSIPRLTKKLQEAGELFIHNRADQGKVTQYIVTVGMSWTDFANSLQAHLKYSDKKCSDLYPWFSKSGVDKLGGVQVGGGTQLCPGGVDIAVSRGVDTAMSTEPSLTTNETSFLENSQNLIQPGDSEETKLKKTHKTSDALLKFLQDGSDQVERDNLNNLADQIAKTCNNINLSTAHPDTKKEIKRIAISFYKMNITPDDLIAFDVWWYDYTWQGKKRQPPTLKQLGDSWGQFEAQKVINVPITTDGGFYV